MPPLIAPNQNPHTGDEPHRTALKSEISNLKSAGAPPLLLQEFDSLAETPDAVSKIRSLILDLAIRGALVPQNPDDSPASNLVQLAKAQKKEQPKPQRASIGNGPTQQPPFASPQGWCWSRRQKNSNPHSKRP